MQCTKQQFYDCLKRNGTFALSTDSEEGAMFYGKLEHFQDCFFTNVEFELVKSFAEEHGGFIEIID